MQLPQELLKKVRILTDKPISPILNKELFPILLHENLQIDKAVPVLCQKYRSDLLIHLFQNSRFPSENTTATMLASITANIISYKLSEVLQLYILVLGRIDDHRKLLQIGYYDLIKPAVKLANLETKERLFQILVSNLEYFYSRKCKKAIMAVVANFLDVFSKFLIYVPSYISLAEVMLTIDRGSKDIINKDHPQRQPRLQQIMIDLSSKQLSMLSSQISLTLHNTKQKLNYYGLHRNCLNALRKIGDILTTFKVKESQLNFTEIDVGQLIRTVEIFQDRKGTIDEARFARTAWIKRLDDLKKIKELKTQKFMNRSFQGLLYVDKKDIDKPLFIEDVISMANNYRLKYQVSPPENDEASQSRIVGISNNFLRKGIGVGGGRTYLMNKNHEKVYEKQKQKNKRKYDDLLSKCFSECDKEFQYKSFVDPPLPITENYEFTVEEPQALQMQKTKLSMQELEHLPVFLDKTIVQEASRLSLSRQSSVLEDDEEIEQINNLIQLAYSYKFS